MNTNEVIEAINNSENLYSLCQLYGILLRKEGSDLIVKGMTVERHLQCLYHTAGTVRNWAAVRYASSLLHHNVDSISPFITAVLVHGKQVSVSGLELRTTKKSHYKPQIEAFCFS